MRQEVKDSPEELTVHVSQFEVYNEQIYDLLAEDTGAVLGQRPALRLKEDSQGRMFVRGLSEVRVHACLRVGQLGAVRSSRVCPKANSKQSRLCITITLIQYVETTVHAADPSMTVRPYAADHTDSKSCIQSPLQRLRCIIHTCGWPQILSSGC